MYKIINSMNNNIVLAKNEFGEEVMLVGNGIGFGKKRNDIVIKSKIEKIFLLRTEESKENFMALLKNVPIDFITLTYDVIDSLSKKYSYPVQEYLYVTLTDHIYCSYQAILKGKYKNSNLPNVSEKYPIPYQIAKDVLEIYRNKISINFPEDEVSRIAYHFMNAEGETVLTETSDLYKRKIIINQIIEYLERNNIHRTRENSNFYDRFMIHLNYFLDYLDRSRDDNKSLLEMEEQIKLTYPRAYTIGNEIYKIIAKETGIDFYQSERVYLVIHIQRLL